MNLKEYAELAIKANEEGKTIVIDDNGQPTLVDVVIEDTRDYKTKRKSEYPSLGDFADAMYKSYQGDNSELENYYKKCTDIKNKYPKG